MNFRTLAIGLSLLFLFTTGCMNTRLVGRYDSDSIVEHKETRVNFLWGLVQPVDISSECESESICQMTSRTNIGFVLVSAITAGIVVPQTVEWDCCPVEPEEDVIGNQ